MSAIFDALFAGLETLEGGPDVLFEMKNALDALHEISHEHEDWLNGPRYVRTAARKLLEAVHDHLLDAFVTRNAEPLAGIFQEAMEE